MLERNVKITNKLGLHLRAAALLVKTASAFESDVRIRRDDIEVDAKSIMGVLGLEGSMGVDLMIRVDGRDEDDALRAVVGLIEARFDEEE
jgi:phosphocarrier protein